uniref:Uncharacterized protein n=1 Tax=viral metagenome TaxID=1070528 RepID=A0A6C0HV84_9ZZZZ
MKMKLPTEIIKENSGRYERSGQRALLATTESRQAELAEDSREFHPVAFLIKQKIEEYYDEDMNYYYLQLRTRYSGLNYYLDLRQQYSSNRQLYTHEFINFSKWVFHCIESKRYNSGKFGSVRK